MSTTSIPIQQRPDVRAHIVEVAMKMFHQQGLRSVTMDDIAHELTMSKRTLYQIFADKEELLLACVKHHGEVEAELLENLAEKTNNVLEFLLVFFKEKLKHIDEVSPQFISDLTKYPRVIEYINQCKHAQEDDAVNFLNKGKEQGLFREDVNFRIVSRQLSSGLDTMVRNGLIEKYPQSELFANTVIPYIRGCTTAKGMELMDKFME